MNIKLKQIDDLTHYEFNETIKQRGLDYFEKGNFISCLKNKNTYFAKVKGTIEYKVKIEFFKNNLIMSCTCPCDFNCKHEFATILSIFTNNYKNITLKRKIPKKTQNIRKTISQIPAEELKQYLLKKPYFNKKDFEQYFIKYMPSQPYNYYYNNLYNSLTLDDNYLETLDDFINDLKIKIKNKNYSNSFIIIKAIINALKDTDNLDNNKLINIYYWLNLILKITYKKSNQTIKNAITSWLNYIKQNNYFESLWLENMIGEILNV